MILGINNDYKLSCFDYGFYIMAWCFAFWMKFLTNFILDESPDLTETNKHDTFIFFSQFFANVGKQV